MPWRDDPTVQRSCWPKRRLGTLKRTLPSAVKRSGAAVLACIAVLSFLAFRGADPAPRHQDTDLPSQAIAGRLHYIAYLPQGYDQGTTRYPVIYLLDGNTWFPGAAAEGWHFNNAIIVGIGVPTEQVAEWRRRRVLDLTPTEDRDHAQSGTGGGIAFAKVLLEEIKPFIESVYKIEPGQRTLYGLSLGGLMTTHVMFTQPEGFDTYVICSPILGWSDGAVLKAEPAFAARARAGEFKLRMLVTAAGDESKAVIDGAASLANRHTGRDVPW